MNDALNIAQKCTGCAHLLDAGWTEPRCADACPTGALKFLEEAEAAELIAGAEVLQPETRAGAPSLLPELPKKFIAGTVYDPVKKEVVRGATCTLTKDSQAVKRGTALENGVRLTVKTDGFGDFWFEGLETGMYSLEIVADGFPSRSFSRLDTEQDINLGDIPLT